MSINAKMTALADAVRDKSGRTDTLTIDEMTTTVQGIETGTDTSDATATADEIFAGETAYTANGKVTGTFTIEDELVEQNDLISQISALVATKANPQSSTPEDLDAELTEQENLISELSSILDSKASGGSGGGGTSTATIELSGMYGTTFQYINESGALTTIVGAYGPYTLPVPGIYIAAAANGSYMMNISISSNVQQLFNNTVYAVFYVSGDGYIFANSAPPGGGN